jgi:hypothetical protein
MKQRSCQYGNFSIFKTLYPFPDSPVVKRNVLSMRECLERCKSFDNACEMACGFGGKKIKDIVEKMQSVRRIAAAERRAQKFAFMKCNEDCCRFKNPTDQETCMESCNVHIEKHVEDDYDFDRDQDDKPQAQNHRCPVSGAQKSSHNFNISSWILYIFCFLFTKILSHVNIKITLI